MNERILTSELRAHEDTSVFLSGWVEGIRDHGKLAFIDLRDRGGVVQVVCLSKNNVLEVAQSLRPESVISIEGVVRVRSEKTRTQEVNGDIEVEATHIHVLSLAHELPFEKDVDVNLDTLFDYRPLTLRSERQRDIFSVQTSIVDAYRRSLARQGFTEFQAPALVGGDAEGGAAVFKVDYFNNRSAYLATSPQLYKQIMVGAFERVFTIAKIFRAEKSATTRHLSELTQMDFEMGFILDERDVMNVLEQVIRDVVGEVSENHKDIFERMNVPIPLLGQSFPVLTLSEAHNTLGVPSEEDMTPEHERAICEWAKENHGSDFVFITRFPTSARAFYTMAHDDTFSRGFDLLFRGLEINSGAQRIHGYDDMVARIRERGMDPNKFQFYLQAFKYGMPPHGGCSTGLERLTMKMLNLGNVKEATPFPRDMNRIDSLLSE